MWHVFDRDRFISVESVLLYQISAETGMLQQNTQDWEK